jgi:hypothetical protein
MSTPKLYIRAYLAVAAVLLLYSVNATTWIRPQVTRPWSVTTVAARERRRVTFNASLLFRGGSDTAPSTSEEDPETAVPADEESEVKPPEVNDPPPVVVENEVEAIENHMEFADDEGGEETTASNTDTETVAAVTTEQINVPASEDAIVTEVVEEEAFPFGSAPGPVEDDEQPDPIEEAPVVASVNALSEEMKAILKELHYRDGEIKLLREEIAQVIVDQKLPRPKAGLPASYYLNGKLPRPSLLHDLLPKVILPAVASVLAVTLLVCSNSNESGPSFVTTTLRRIFPRRRTSLDLNSQRLKPPLPLKVEEETLNDESVGEDSETDVADQGEDVGGDEEEDAPVHSIKPGEIPHDNPDRSRLDKFLSKIERFIQKILNMTI